MMNPVVIKKYLLLMSVFFVLFAVFIYLEKNNVEYSYQLNDDKSLDERSVAIIKKLREDDITVKFEVYTQKDTAIARKIKQFFIPFKRINNQIQIEFINPVTNPSKVTQNAITMQGEILLSYADMKKPGRINITELSESAIVNAILRLQNDKDEWMIIAEGYGMASIDDETQSGLSTILIELKKVGLHVARMPLNVALILPENVKLIVLAAPKEVLDAQMVAWLQKQINQGISLWWLNDVNTSPQPNLELVLDVMAGDIVKLGNDKETAMISEFPTHVITDKFNQPLFIAQAVEIIAPSSNALLQTQAATTIAVSKQLEKSRVVVTGDVDFITNQYINVAANKSMALRILDWLYYHDERVNIPLLVNENTQLFLTQFQLLVISVFFLIILPLLFIIIAWKKWRMSGV